MSIMSDKAATKLFIVVLFAALLMFFLFVRWKEGVQREDDQAKAEINNNPSSATPE